MQPPLHDVVFWVKGGGVVMVGGRVAKVNTHWR